MKVIPESKLGALNAAFMSYYQDLSEYKSITSLIDAHTIDADLVKREDISEHANRKKTIRCVYGCEIEDLPAWDGKP